MIDKFDYSEPTCPLCSGKEFYYPEKDAPLGKIPISRILDKVDRLFDKNDYKEAGRLLVHWENEAIELKDKSGELAILSELIGYYRKQNEREKGITSVLRALDLIKELGQTDTVSGATIFINCATAYKAFGMPQDALPLYEYAEQIYLKKLKPEDEKFGGLYNNMALALADTGNFKKAEQAYNSALKVMEQIQGGEAESAITYINMAHMYEESGDLEKIRECMDKAFSLLQSENLQHNGYYAFVLEKCAPSFGYFGNAELCEQMKREAAEIYARA